MSNKNSSSTSREGVKDIDTNSIIDSIIKVMGDQQIKVPLQQTAIGIAKGTGIGGTCMIIGGLVAGPAGLAAGASLGGLLAYSKTKGTFKSITQIFNELPPERKQQIAYEIKSIANKLGIKDWAEFVKIAIICASLASDPKNALVKEFIRQSIPIIERHALECNGNDGN